LKKIDLTQHTLIGAGGENLVFVDANRTEVVKVNYFTIMDLKNNREKAILDVDRRNQDVEQLREYFEKNGEIDPTLHPTDNAYEISWITLAREQLNQVINKIGTEVSLRNLGITNGNDNEVTLETIVSRQAYVSLKNSKTHSFYFDSYEVTKEPQILEALIRDFTCHSGDLVQYKNSLIDLFPSVAPLLEKPLMQTALIDFVGSLIRYIKETGRSIDFEGKGNIFFIEKGEESIFVLMDVVQAEPKDYLNSKRTFEQKRNGEISHKSNIDEIVLPELYQFYGINLLAASLGIKERIDSITSQQYGVTVNPEELRRYILEVVHMRSNAAGRSV